MTAPTSTLAQRIRLHNALKNGPVTTLDARRKLDILHPAMRVKELKCSGVGIDKVMVEQRTDAGDIHRVARYFLTGTQK